MCSLPKKVSMKKVDGKFVDASKVVEAKANVKVNISPFDPEVIDILKRFKDAWFSDQEDDSLFEPATDALLLANRIMWMFGKSNQQGEFDLHDAFAVLFKILTPEDLLFISRHEEYIFGKDEDCEPLNVWHEATKDFTPFP